MKERILKSVKVVTQDYMPSNGKHYYIIKTKVGNKMMYGVIEHDNVDSNGKLIKPLNGFQLMLCDTVAKLLERMEASIKIDRLAETENISRQAAILLHYGNGKMTKEEAVEFAKQFE